MSHAGFLPSSVALPRSTTAIRMFAEFGSELGKNKAEGGVVIRSTKSTARNAPRIGCWKLRVPSKKIMRGLGPKVCK